MPKQIPIFVISLKRAPDRRMSVSEHLESLGLTYHIFEAADGNLMSPEYRNSLLAPGISYVAGVVGCYVSHINVYKHMLENQIEVALILEDDARLDRRIVNSLKQGALLTKDFDYCLLDSEDCSENTPAYYDIDSRRMMFPGFPVYETNIGPALLHAYFMTFAGAERRVEHAWPIRKPVDVYSSLPYKPLILVFVDPKGAFVSEHSRQSFTSTRHDIKPLRLRALRRFPLFYKIRDWVKLKPIIGMLRIFELKRSGALDPKRRWRPMPTGRNIIDI